MTITLQRYSFETKFEIHKDASKTESIEQNESQRNTRQIGNLVACIFYATQHLNMI